MNKLKEHPAYKMAREKYGLENELCDLQEECAELIAEINRYKKFPIGSEKRISAFWNMIEEIADVENLLQQMRFWFWTSENTINEIRIEKLDRLKERIENEYEQHN